MYAQFQKMHPEWSSLKPSVQKKKKRKVELKPYQCNFCFYCSRTPKATVSHAKKVHPFLFNKNDTYQLFASPGHDVSFTDIKAIFERGNLVTIFYETNVKDYFLAGRFAVFPDPWSQLHWMDILHWNEVIDTCKSF